MSDLAVRMAEAMGWELTSIQCDGDPPKSCFYKDGKFLSYTFTGSISLVFDVVVPFMAAKGFRYVLKGNFMGDGKHYAAFDQQDFADANPPYQSGPCDLPGEAIVLAALKALEEGE